MQMSSCLTVSFSVLICTERLQAVSVTYCILAPTGISVFDMLFVFIVILFNKCKLQLLCTVNKACQMP